MGAAGWNCIGWPKEFGGRGCTIKADRLALNTPETAQYLPPYELEPRISPDEYFISYVEKLQPQYNQTKIARMPGISRKSLSEKRQGLDIPAHKQ